MVVKCPVAGLTKTNHTAIGVIFVDTIINDSLQKTRLHPIVIKSACNCTTTYTILRSFQTNNINLIVNLFKTFVRPTLEFNTSIWNPNFKKDIISVENVQRKFSKRLCQKNNIKFNSYRDRLEILKLESLEMRRFKRDLILMYKIYNKLIDINFEDFFAKSSSTYSTRGNSYRLQVPRYSSSTVRNNFFSDRVLIP